MDSQPDDPRQNDETGTPRRSSAYRTAVTVGIVALAFAALWFLVNLLYALL